MFDRALSLLTAAALLAGGFGVPAMADGMVASTDFIAGGLGNETAGDIGSVALPDDAELIWRHGLSRTSRSQTSVLKLESNTEIGIRIEPRPIGRAGADSTTETMVYGSIGLSETWALTGAVRTEAVDLGTGTEASFGVRYSTRAGDQFMVSVEPSLTFADTSLINARISGSDFGFRAVNRGYEPDAGLQAMSLGATATYAITSDWFVSGMAQFQQYVGPGRDRGLMLGESEVVGGFITGVRF